MYHLDKRTVKRRERSSIVRSVQNSFIILMLLSVLWEKQDRRSRFWAISTNLCSILLFVSQIESCFLILEPKGLDRLVGKQMTLVLSLISYVSHLFPSNNSDAAKRDTDLPRFPHLISNHKLIVRFYSCVFSMFYLEFYNRLFFYIFFFLHSTS